MAEEHRVIELEITVKENDEIEWKKGCFYCGHFKWQMI